MLSRMKFEIQDLVLDILNRLPESVWTSNSTTFFDPAFGGGQFVCEIEKKLRAHGHSDANIRQRVFGLEESELFVRYAVNKHNLVGQYARKPYNKFFELGSDMKFDVVIGNPPYQDSRAPTLKLWHKFVEQGFALVKDKGYMAFVTPRSWVERPQSQLSNRIVNNIFKMNQVAWIDITAKNYFPNIGENPCSYGIIKTPKTQLTEVQLFDKTVSIDYVGQKIPLDKLDQYKVAIFPKIKDQGFGNLLSVVYSDTGTADSVDIMIKDGLMSTKRSKTSVNVFWTAANTDTYFMAKTKIKAGIKVIINRSGYYYQPENPNKYILIDDSQKYAVGAGAYGITCKTVQEAKNLVSLLTTKLYRWFIDNEKTSGFNTGITKLPLLSLQKSWTDREVYDLFQITQDEEQHINDFYN